MLCEVVLALLIAHPTSLSAETPAASAPQLASYSSQADERPAQPHVLSRAVPRPLPASTPTQTAQPTVTPPAPPPSPTPTAPPTPAYLAYRQAGQTGRPTATPVASQLEPAATPLTILSPPTPTPSPPTPVPPTSVPSLPARACEQQLIALVNQFRIDNGMAPLLQNPLLSAAAQQFADFIASYSILSHTADGRTLDARAEAAGYSDWTTLGENLAGGYATAEEAFEAWLASAPHRHNILNPAFLETGVGCAWNADSPYGYLWVQEFGAR